jgi:uncharacterized circularly permuted ATP-grasp superfamily protein
MQGMTMIKMTPSAPYYDEMLTAEGRQRQHYDAGGSGYSKLTSMPFTEERAGRLLFHRVGITFNVYGEEGGTERLIPFDSVPRIIPAHEWRMLDAGIRQRVKALNAFLYDIYHHQHILNAGIVPREQVLANDNINPVCRASICITIFMPISPASIWSATVTAATTCWRIICAPHPASLICWKTAR